MEKEKKLRGSNEISDIIILFKSDNQKSILLTQNLVFHSKTKYINIQHDYIRNKVVFQKFQLSYILIEKMIANSLIKTLIHIKFHGFIKQISIT